MLAIVALVCLVLVSASSANGVRKSDYAQYGRFEEYITKEMAKSENFREVFEPVMDRQSFFEAPCSYMMESYLKSGYDYVNERYQDTLASLYFAKVAGEKVRQCAEKFDHYAQKMPIMMLEWSFDDLFKKLAHMARKPGHQALAEAAAKFSEGYDPADVCKVAAAINKLRKDEKSPLTQEMVKGETEVRGSALVMWSEQVDKNMAAQKEVDCKQEVAQFFKDTCKSDLVSNRDGVRFVAFALKIGMELDLSERARKYKEYNRVCFDEGDSKSSSPSS